MAASVETLNKGLAYELSRLEVVAQKRAEAERGFQAEEKKALLSARTLWFRKHVYTMKPEDYEADQDEVRDLLAYAKRDGIGATALTHWLHSYDPKIAWIGTVKNGLPLPYIVFHEDVSEMANMLPAISRLSKALAVNGQAEMELVFPCKNGLTFSGVLKVLGENFDRGTVIDNERTFYVYDEDDVEEIPVMPLEDLVKVLANWGE